MQQPSSRGGYRTLIITEKTSGRGAKSGTESFATEQVGRVGAMANIAVQREVYSKHIAYIRQHPAIIRVAHPDFHRPKLVVFDLDGTLVQGEFMMEVAERCLAPELAARLRQLTSEAIARTEAWEDNYIDRVALLEGLELEPLRKIYRAMPIVKGIEELVRAKSADTHFAIVTGAWLEYAQEVADRLAIPYCFGTEWEVKEGRLTGLVTDEARIMGPTEKWQTVERLAAQLRLGKEAIAVVADGLNDLEMMTRVGCSIFLHARPHNPLPLATHLERLLSE